MSRRFPFAFPACLLITATVGSCAAPGIVPQPARPVPIPTPTPPPRPMPTPTPVLAADWRDWPMTPGGWVYRQDERGSIALYGRTGADAELTVRCDRARRLIYLSRRGEGPGRLTVRTSSTLRAIDALPTGGMPAYLAVELAPRDPLLDAIAFSRGRFVVEGGGVPALVAPTWADVPRVIEDCR